MLRDFIRQVYMDRRYTGENGECTGCISLSYLVMELKMFCMEEPGTYLLLLNSSQVDS